jgi:uncharacterized protein YbaR (Trm112 family)
MIDPELLRILCCPETHQEVREAEPTLIARLNQQIAAGAFRDRGGKPVSEQIDGGLIRADGRFLYPIRHGIPVMLVDDAMPIVPCG